PTAAVTLGANPPPPKLRPPILDRARPSAGGCHKRRPPPRRREAPRHAAESRVAGTRRVAPRRMTADPDKGDARAPRHHAVQADRRTPPSHPAPLLASPAPPLHPAA